MSCAASAKNGFTGDCADCPFPLQFCIENNKDGKDKIAEVKERHNDIKTRADRGENIKQIASDYGLKRKTIIGIIKGYRSYCRI